MAIADVIRAIRGGSLVGAFILSFCIIDYLAGILEKSDNTNYKKIIDDYFDDYNSEYMYAIRCSLVHVYGKADAMHIAGLNRFNFEHKRPEIHKQIDNIDGVIVYWLNLSNFVFDVVKASYNFFTENLENKSESELEEYVERANNIIRIFDPVTGETTSIKTNFGSIDPIFSSLDSDNVNWDFLENEIYKLCLSK